MSFFTTILDKVLFRTLHTLLVIMKKVLLSLGLAWAVMSVQAQTKDHWSKGEVLLTSGEHVTGALVYASDAEVVSIKMDDGTQKTYGSFQIQSFHFLDLRHQLMRHFKKSVLPDEGREAIVEVVFDGELQVQRCFKPKYRRYAQGGTIFNFYPSEVYDHGRYQYFVHDGVSLRTFEHFLRKDFGPKTKRWNKQLENFRFRNQLDNGINSWLKLVHFYNVLENDRKSHQYLPKTTRDSTQLIVSNRY